MIKEIIFASLLQGADLSSTVIAEKRGFTEANPLMAGDSRYVTSAITVAGTGYGLSKIKSKKTRIFVGAGLVVFKGWIVYHNLNLKKR